MSGPDSESGDGITGHDSASISIADCSLSFGDLSVLEDVSLEIEPGEFVGFVGPNGAGKTTLLRLISGALEPDSGTVTIDGVDVHDASSRTSSRLVSVVPQDTSLSFSFPVRDVVEMGRHPHRSRFSSPSPEDRAAVERALERTRTADLADRPIDEVSGGQRQRVVLARAIAQATPVMLLDEPTASLDINHQVETLESVRELVAEGRTVVAAIHDLDLAARYCDRLVLLADGAVARDGPPSAVVTSGALADSFDANAVVTPNPVTGTETVTAFATDREAASLPDRVHVLGSGSAAAGVIARLEAAGIEVTLGPVTSGDSAAETARSLGTDALVLEPFTPISSADRADAERLVREADVAVAAGVGATGGEILERLDGTPPLVVVGDRSAADSSRSEPAIRNAADRERDRNWDQSREGALEATTETVLAAVAEAAARWTQSASSTESAED
ncbi:ATP-binding cassette domain-containing protein [Natrinema versiforme]|uniref:Cobalamin import ATP-binding protein BtuD n=1 Tax=Natrinema versiforme TaxID=88724 RepID=A0A4P8WH79_9EURY|nr:ATP-binding cassette domain-containing protein [Natrinema versiforme]QCS42758.1 ATP-binding cassette domain-containing protein [Natrinema versiforme]